MKRHLLAAGVAGLFPLLGAAILLGAAGVEAVVVGVHHLVRR